jgi:Predicted transcriptional regulator
MLMNQLFCPYIYCRIKPMIKLNVQNILDEKKKTRYWLVKKLESDYKTVNKLCDNTSTAISFKMIKKLCDVLECTLNDLFVID